MSTSRRIKKISKYLSDYYNGRLGRRRENQAFISRAIRTLKRYHGDEVERALRKIARHIRPHASFFKWSPRQKAVEELGVARFLVEAVGGPPLDFQLLRPQSPDPPDVVGERADGRHAAIELVELVDEEAASISVPAMKSGRIDKVVHRVWDCTLLIETIARLLAGKDGKTLHGGPYAQYVVLLYSDEMMLTHADAVQCLDEHVFTGLTQATDAYLLFSYDPATDGYPCIKLAISN